MAQFFGNLFTKLADIRLIAVTGYGQASDRKRALSSGFDVHLVKPVSMDHLLEVLLADPEAED